MQICTQTSTLPPPKSHWKRIQHLHNGLSPVAKGAGVANPWTRIQTGQRKYIMVFSKYPIPAISMDLKNRGDFHHPMSTLSVLFPSRPIFTGGLWRISSASQPPNQPQGAQVLPHFFGLKTSIFSSKTKHWPHETVAARHLHRSHEIQHQDCLMMSVWSCYEPYWNVAAKYQVLAKELSQEERPFTLGQ